MNVCWFEQSVTDVPAGEAWLSATEANHLRAMRFPKRRADWRLGRWTAKNGVALFLNIPANLPALSDIEIRPALSGAPEVFFRNEPAAVTISLSHRAGIGACVLAPPGVLLGCDLESVEPRGDAFATDYFTAEEQAFVAQAGMTERWPLLALIWSGKESALKALREGLRLDTRQVIVSFPGGPNTRSQNEKESARSAWGSDSASSPCNGWSPLQVRHTNGQTFHGWWSQTGDLLRTVLAAPPPDPPMLLTQACLQNC